jgi:glutamate dehydrogenase/leucine dehydrogenase
MVFENIESMIDKLSGIMKLNDNEKKILLTHKSVQKADLEVDGKNYKAFRIVHNNALGPGKGGIRFHPNVSEDEVKSLSFWMSVKNSLAGLPYGGGKGGVIVNPKELSQEQLQKLSRAFVQAFHEHIGQDKDVPAPDVYTNPQIMAWMLDEYEKIKGRHEPGVITGKPIALGGIPLRADSTSKEGLIVFQELAKIKNLGKDVKIAIQGFGNAGWNMAKFLHKEGYKVVAVSDSKGGIFDENGLDVLAVKKIKDEEKTVTKHNGKQLTNEEILELDVDVLCLAALENQIREDNADKIKAKYIIELANGPISAEADSILYQKGVFVLPDILANAGGVVGSYFEWVQNRTGNGFTDEYIEEEFTKKMKNTFHKVYSEFDKDEHQEHDMRTVCYVVALKRILEAEKIRGHS